jgi:hypothetical protein
MFLLPTYMNHVSKAGNFWKKLIEFQLLKNLKKAHDFSTFKFFI